MKNLHPFVAVGHTTDVVRATGLTVFLFEKPLPAACYVCGAAPASSELATLALVSPITAIHALVLTGGSAFGLGAVMGVMTFLQQRGQGVKTRHGYVPIVPAAAIYDLGAGDPQAAPTPADALLACEMAVSAQSVDHLSGQVGAGTGARVGKLVPNAEPMAGGLGWAQRRLPDGLTVTAWAVVNSRGDVRDWHGNIIAGARFADGQFADCEKFLLSGQAATPFTTELNTTLVAIFIDAALTRDALQRIARVATTGIARAISPVFTRFDGDIVFCVATGQMAADEEVVSVLAANVVQAAIIHAVMDKEKV